ncbi:MAG: ABC transporter substrate-binding protein [Armatimonadota bacterium]|jgi:iron complex transport system substrate-binding protein
MRRITRLLAFMLLPTALLMIAGCPPAPPPMTPEEPSPSDELDGWPRTFTDALGEEVTLEQPPRRIVSLSTGFAEAIFAMGAGERLVGRVTFADYPPEIQQVPAVGGMIDASLEAIVAQEPDLVLTVRGTPREVVDSIRRAGIPVIARDPTSIDEVIECIRDIGRYLGIEEDADELADGLSTRVEAVRERGDALASGQGRPSVLFVVGLDPVFVAGPEHFVDDMIFQAGGINAGALVTGESAGQWPSLSMEAVVELSPDIVVIAMMDQEDWAEIDDGRRLADQPGWGRLSAVEGGRVFTLDPDLAVRAGPRLIDALEQMAEIIEDAVAGGPRDG